MLKNLLYNGYKNIKSISQEYIRNEIYFDDNKFLLELKNNKELNGKEQIRHDVMSYGNANKIGKYITNYDTLQYLAFTDLNYCFVENKTKYYILCFDFDYKIDKYYDLYKNYINNFDDITFYIIDKIIDTLHNTLNRIDDKYIYSCKQKSFGVHIYFPNIITNRLLHKYIVKKTIEVIQHDNKYPIDMINKIFDESIAGANGIRLFYYKNNNDYYAPILEKSTFKFDDDKEKHFAFSIINTDYEIYEFNLKDNVSIEENIYEVDTKTKIKDKSKNIIKEDVEYINDIKILDIGEKKDFFIALTNILDIKRIDNYESWIKLIYLHKTYNLFDEMVLLSKKSQKYDQSAYDKIYKIFANKTNPKDKIITLGSLIKWCREDNKEKTNVLFNKYNIPVKLEVDNLNKILLRNEKFIINYNEECKYISNEALNFIINEIKNKKDCIIIHSPTGSGKTTIINKILKFLIENNKNDYKILSIVSRRSMSATHLTSFNELKFTSYLDYNKDYKKYFISSMEYLAYLEGHYDIIILDEITSLLNYFYSDTLEGKRYSCIFKLIQYIKNAKLIIAVDANINDMIYELFSILKKEIVYYKNTFKNKQNVLLNIFYCKKYNEDNNLYEFCKDIIEEYIKNNKTCLIMTDSKEITEKLRVLFNEYNPNDDYYRVFNREEGELEDIKNINNIGKNRIIIFNSRILYGVDITIEYDKVYAIYRKSYGLNSIGAMEMFQQISRTRNTKCVDLLVLNPKTRIYKNEYVSFEYNKEKQNKMIINNISINPELYKKNEQIVNDFRCTIFKNDGSVIIDENAFMINIHYLKTWYDILFVRNKIDIIKLCAKDVGYIITEKDFDPEYNKNNLIATKLKERREEIKVVVKQLYNNDEINVDIKYDKMICNINEQIEQRRKFVDYIKDKVLLEKLCTDQNAFGNYFSRLYLNLSKDKLIKKYQDKTEKNIFSISKSTDLVYQKIMNMFKIEELLKFNRFDLDSIKSDNIEDAKKLLLNNIDSLKIIFKNKDISEIKIINKLKLNINKVINNNLLQRFIAECYNNISDNTFIIKSKRKQIDYVKNNFYIFKLHNYIEK